MQLPTVYKGDEPYIFISYSHRDKELVYPVLSRLTDAGFRVWFDEGIDPGTEWDENIASHIGGSAYFIAFLTKNYMGSKNCKDELSYARSLDKGRLLVYMEPVELPEGMKMRLNRLQAIHWYKYSDGETPFKKLCHATGIDLCRAAVGKALPSDEARASAEGAVTIPASAPKPKRRWWIAAVCVLAAAAVAGVLLSRLGHREETVETVSPGAEETVEADQMLPEPEPTPVYHITFSAGDMPVGSYKTNLEILERRIALLAGDEDYTFTAADDAAELTIPRAAFGDADPERLLGSCLCAGAALYAYDYDSAFLAAGGVPYSEWSELIPPEDIDSVEMTRGTAPIDTEGSPWYLTSAEDVLYLTITLTDEAAERLAACAEGHLAELMLDFDSADFQQLRSYPGEDEKTWYIVPYTESETEIALLCELLMSPPLDHRFEYALAFEPDWQSMEALSAPGANQVDVGSLDGNTVTLQYSFYAKPTEGQWIDMEALMKQRLDILDTPYSFGTWLDGFTVRLSPEHMLTDVAYCLGAYSCSLQLRCGLREFSNIGKILIEDRGDGTYALRLGPYSYNQEEAIRFGEAVGGGDEPVVLWLNETPILIAQPEAIEEDGSIAFDRLYTDDEDPITDDALWLLNVIRAIEEGDSPTTTLSNTNILWDDDEGSYGLKLRSDSAAAMERICEALPEAEAELDGTNAVSVHLGLPIDEMLVPTGTAMARTAFEAAAMETCDVVRVAVYLTDEDTEPPIRTRLFFEKQFTDYSYSDAEADGSICVRGIFGGERVERYIDAFREVVETDAFYAPLTEAYKYGEAFIYEW